MFFGVMMGFSGKGLVGFRGWALVAACGAAVMASVALVACGGGTTQQTVFKPTRVLAFGDETSVLTATGTKYAVNALDANAAVDCLANPLWIQTVARIYTFEYPQCNPTASAEVKAFTRAAPGAQVNELRAQIDQQVSVGAGGGGGIGAGDLALVMVGANDVLALYAQYPTRSEADILTDARARGDLLAAQVNRLVNLGARVIVSSAIDVGVTPFAVAQKAAFTDTDRAALLTRITAALNGRMRVGILNDGRFVGLVLADEMVQTMVKSPASFALTDAVSVICNVALPDCTSKTLIDTATEATWLWADATHLSAAGQTRLGSLAQQRAQGNPF